MAPIDRSACLNNVIGISLQVKDILWMRSIHKFNVADLAARFERYLRSVPPGSSHRCQHCDLETELGALDDMPLRRARSDGAAGGQVREPVHRLIRDAVEAEELAVEWLRWIGVEDAVRLDELHAVGVRGSGTRAEVSFDPLPMERDALARVVDHFRADGADLVVSFTFAGWTPLAYAWANEQKVALVRFTFAGHLDPSNYAATLLRPR